MRKYIDRIERLILTLISKQWLVFAIGTLLLVRGYINAEVWLMLAGVVIGVNTFLKVKGAKNAAIADNRQHD